MVPKNLLKSAHVQRPSQSSLARTTSTSTNRTSKSQIPNTLYVCTFRFHPSPLFGITSFNYTLSLYIRNPAVTTAVLILASGQYISFAHFFVLFKPHFVTMNGDVDSPDSVIQLVHIPRQNISIPKSCKMKAIVCSQPPLGQITTTSETSTNFTVELEVDTFRENDGWEVSLWYTQNGSCYWEELVLRRSPTKKSQSLQLFNSTSHFLYFTADLPTTAPIDFTIKFRNAKDQPWKWVKDAQGMEDGVIILRPSADQGVSPDLKNYIKGMDPALRVQIERSQAPQTTLWSVTTFVAAAIGEESSFTDIKIGVPWGKFLK